jgi:glycine/D-amino acid oxidase-like deaminating enzyme
MASTTTERNIVIVGGGIIGSTTAYFLTRHAHFNPATHKITIVEAQSIASAASGKAGGLLALWAYPKCLVPLSYKLHEELAREHDGEHRWGYRALHCGALQATGQHHQGTAGDPTADGGREWAKLPKTDRKLKSTNAGIPQDLEWFDAEAVQSYSEMGTPSTTAQVHPYQFTTSMADLAVEAGAKVVLGSVTAIDYYGQNGVKGVTYEDKGTKHIHTLPATDVILAAGPWTSHVFPEAPIEALRAHSVVIKADVSPYAIFSEINLPKDFGWKDRGDAGKRRHGSIVSPEMYARPDGTVYACG